MRALYIAQNAFYPVLLAYETILFYDWHECIKQYKRQSYCIKLFQVHLFKTHCKSILAFIYYARDAWSTENYVCTN